MKATADHDRWWRTLPAQGGDRGFGVLQLVASWPTGDSLPPGLRHTTADALVYLVTNAASRIRLAAPFMDETGVGYLTDALVSATRREVTVELFLSTRSTHGGRAVADL